MRTAIYVAAPSTVTIRATDPRDSAAQLYRFQRGAGKPALGIHELEAGIYLVLSNQAVEVIGDDLTVASLSKDKDIPPEPKARVLAAEPGATMAAVCTFFGVAKDADPPAPPVAPVEDDAGGSGGGGAGDVEDA